MPSIFSGMARVLFPERVIKLVAEIDEFKGYWHAAKGLIPISLQSQKDAATVASVGASTRIEGSKLTDKLVEKLIRDSDAPEELNSRDEQEVAGCAMAWKMVLDQYQILSLNENNIKLLHYVMCQFSEKDEEHRGEYKQRENSVVAYDNSGKVFGVVLKTTSSDDTPIEMAELVKWTNEQLEQRRNPYSMHPLVAIGIFKVVFLAIHPFEDGNGRLSRLLTTLLMLRNGYDYVQYTSLDSLIEQSKAEYYSALRRTQNTLRSENQDWNSWLEYFLSILSRQKDTASEKTKEWLTAKEEDLSPDSIAIIDFVRREGRITTRKAFELLDIPRPTVRRRLEQLVDHGRLEIHGKGKGTYYSEVKDMNTQNPIWETGAMLNPIFPSIDDVIGGEFVVAHHSNSILRCYKQGFRSSPWGRQTRFLQPEDSDEGGTVDYDGLQRSALPYPPNRPEFKQLLDGTTAKAMEHFVDGTKRAATDFTQNGVPLIPVTNMREFEDLMQRFLGTTIGSGEGFIEVNKKRLSENRFMHNLETRKNEHVIYESYSYKFQDATMACIQLQKGGKTEFLKNRKDTYDAVCKYAEEISSKGNPDPDIIYGKAYQLMKVKDLNGDPYTACVYSYYLVDEDLEKIKLLVHPIEIRNPGKIPLIRLTLNPKKMKDMSVSQIQYHINDKMFSDVIKPMYELTRPEVTLEPIRCSRCGD